VSQRRWRAHISQVVTPRHEVLLLDLNLQTQELRLPSSTSIAAPDQMTFLLNKHTDIVWSILIPIRNIIYRVVS
jgi:hypothetical protein